MSDSPAQHLRDAIGSIWAAKAGLRDAVPAWLVSHLAGVLDAAILVVGQGLELVDAASVRPPRTDDRKERG